MFRVNLGMKGMHERLGSQLALHWVCHSPSHYNDDLFQAIHDSGINLMVHFRHVALASHPWKTPLRHGYESRALGRVGVDWRLLRLAIVERNAVFVLAGWRDVTSLLLIALGTFLDIRYIIWTDTPDIGRARSRSLVLVRRWVLRQCYHHALAIMGTGKPAIEALAAMGAPAEKLVSFPYWIDLDRYGALPVISERGTGNRIRFISSGRLLNAVKGHDIAIRSLVMADHLVGGADFEYVVAGSGPDEKALRQLAEDLGVGHKVRFLGWVEPEALAVVFRDGDVLIHPSPVLEPYGVAVIEAMASGLLVLASDETGAALDRIQHGYNGLIHRAGDVAQLADQVGWCLRHPGALHEMRAHARKTAGEWPVARGVKMIEKLMSKVA